MDIATAIKWNLVADAIGRVDPLITPTTAGKVPDWIECEVRAQGTGIGSSPWTYASHEIRVMIAIADTFWKRRLSKLSVMDEAALQSHFGANALSTTDTIDALSRMNEEIDRLSSMRAICEMMPSLALAVVGRSTVTLLEGSSQTALDQMGRQHLMQACRRDLGAIDTISARLGRAIPANEKILYAHLY